MEVIRSYIDSLLPALGGLWPEHEAEGLRKLHATRTGFIGRPDWWGLIFSIAYHMRLFENRVVIKHALTNEVVGKGAPMSIKAPTDKTDYLLPGGKITRVHLFLNKRFLDERPFEWAVAGIAHELSHVMLYMKGHPLKSEEKAVDLTAMILGYRRYYVYLDEIKRRPTGMFMWTEETAHLGYINTEEAQYAYNYIRNLDARAG